MSISRHLFALGICAVLISGCTNTGFPDVTSSFSNETRRSDWPIFLPVDTILSGELTNFETAQTEIQNLQARAQRLRRRAQMLRGPVLAIQERLRMQQAVTLWVE